MTTSLLDAMRKARSLVSSQRLAEATRTIQTALGGHERQAGDGRPKAKDTGPTIELERADRHTSEHGRAEHARAPAATPGAHTAESSVRSGRDGLSQRLARTLADTPLGRFGADIGLLRPQAFAGRDGERDGVEALPGTFLVCGYSGPAGSLGYKLYVPSRHSTKPRPLIVMLHGCTQNPDDFALGTRMNALAEAEGALVAYPRQSPSANAQRCWNWFSPAHQERDAGEPAIIAGIVAAIAEDYSVDPARVFAAGLSAGGAMAAVLGATYPDVFAAVGVHSGLPHRAASDVMSALQVMRSGREKNASAGSESLPARMIVFHGDSDQTVHPANGEHLVRAFGQPTGKPSVKKGEINARNYTKTVAAKNGVSNALEYWQVEGLGHAWSGGERSGSYVDPLGPDASREMLRFFLQGTR